MKMDTRCPDFDPELPQVSIVNAHVTNLRSALSLADTEQNTSASSTSCGSAKKRPL